MDISPEALDMAHERIASRLPEVCVEPVVANHVTHPPQIESFNGTTLAIYIGSSIGNFSSGEARAILKNLNPQLQVGDALLVWSKNSNSMKWRDLGFCTASLFEWASPIQKQRLQSRFHEVIDYGGIQDALGAVARLYHRNSESRTLVAKRMSGGGEPDPERSDQGPAAAFGGRRKGDTGRDRAPSGLKDTGRRGGNSQARYDSELVSEAHREQI